MKELKVEKKKEEERKIEIERRNETFILSQMKKFNS